MTNARWIWLAAFTISLSTSCQDEEYDVAGDAGVSDAGASDAAVPDGRPPGPSGFTIWDAFRGPAFDDCDEPDMAALGIETMRMIYAQSFFPSGSEDFDEDMTRQWLRDHYGASFDGYIAIDIEHLCLFPADWCTEQQVEDNIDTHARLANIVREELPNAKFGFYGNLGPMILGCTVDKTTDPDFLEWWREVNDAMQPITDRVDFMVPSMYHNFAWEDRSVWAACATAVAQEASRMSDGKPVYVFTLTRHNVHAPDEVESQPLPYEYFLFTLNTLYDNGSSGVVYWDGDGCDGLDQWWPATQDFITDVLGGQADPP